MKYLIDTDTIIYWLKGNQEIEEKARQVGLEVIGFSIISKAELYYGAYYSAYTEKNLENIKLLENSLQIINFTDEAARIFGYLKADLKKSGNIISDADIMIASITLANDLILVTNNTKHFHRIYDLKLENWIK